MDSRSRCNANQEGNLPSVSAPSCEPKILNTVNAVRDNQGPLPPSYEFTLKQTPDAPSINITSTCTVSRPAFRPPLSNQLTSAGANELLDSADAAWDQERWTAARVQYNTAAAVFNTTGDKRNEAFCLQRLGEVCRIAQDLKAARAHIWRAHVLFGECGEISRQLMCERWLARVASDEGLEEEARLLLHSALDHSRAANLRESEGWCLLRLGQLEDMTEILQQALAIAQEEKIELLERRCAFNLPRTSEAGTSNTPVVVGSSRCKLENNSSQEPRQKYVSSKEEEEVSLDSRTPSTILHVDKSVQVEAELVAIKVISTNRPKILGLSSTVKRIKRWLNNV